MSKEVNILNVCSEGMGEGSKVGMCYLNGKSRGHWLHIHMGQCVCMDL